MSNHYDRADLAEKLEICPRVELARRGALISLRWMDEIVDEISKVAEEIWQSS